MAGQQKGTRRANSALAELRAQALKREQDVARKIKRNEAKGVALEGSKFDPRKGAASIGRMTTAQVQAHLRRLDKTMDRRNQFVGVGREGVPVKASVWRAYKRVERRHNRNVNSHYDQFKDLELPDGNTVDKRMWTAQHPYSDKDKAVNPIFNPKERVPANFQNEGGLRYLTKYLRGVNDDAQFQGRLSAEREQFAQLIDSLGDEELHEKVNSMSDKQFHALWNYSDFVSQLSIKYEILKKLNTTNKKTGKRPKATRADEGLAALSYKNAHRLVDHALRNWKI